jgi:hypothetical protein
VGGANILSLRSLSLSLCVGILKRWCSVADAWRPTIRADVVTLTKASRVAVPRGPLLLSGNHGPEVIMITTPEPMGLRAYVMRGDSILVPPLHLLVVQHRLMSVAWTHSSASGYAEHAVWARSATPDGLLLTW